MRQRFAIVALVLACASTAGAQGFDHQRHARLFPSCTACHAGAENPDSGLFPSATGCAACHDGTIQPRVTWQPPTTPHPSNLKFVHDLVPLMTHPTPRGPEPLGCRDCHIPDGAPWMTVQRAQPDKCLSCHSPGATHMAAPDSACATCHVPLVRAASLRRDDIAEFPAPASHRTAGWATRNGHGRMAAAGAQSCAVCHARDFCMTCHVDAPERAAIQALQPDPRSTAIAVKLERPASHRDETWLQRHGATARTSPQQCATCHTQESCLACHAASQRVAVALHPAGPGRGMGAQPRRGPPLSHRENFASRHASIAAATPGTCAGCHVRTDCMQCHRPNAASAPAYHPAGFVTRHPAAAYSRETRCADCHNAQSFCQSCHAQAGLVATRGPLGSGYHDASRQFIAGHGQAARQSLESCAACHAERDCLTCHSALGARRFNPHGPGFDAQRLRRKNAQMCTACHGNAIPED